MSSPAGHHSSQADLIARWTPSTSRAGVILNPSPDLIGGLRHITAVGSTPLVLDDSFTSDFAQLAGSADSSCFSGDGGERTGTDRAVNNLYSAAPKHPNGEGVTFDEMASKAQDLPLIMKLDQLRKWQQHMQEQLKAHQLEELLYLQEEQQRLLGMMDESQYCKRGQAECTEMSEAKLAKQRETSTSHKENNHEVQPGSSTGLQQEEWLPPAARQKRLSEGSWNSREDDLEESDNRPIRPGIGGQMKTFEELLEEQLKLEEQRLQEVHHQKGRPEAVKTPPKRTFLKRGKGLSRFANNPKFVPQKTNKRQSQAKLMSRSNSEPASLLKMSTSVPRPPSQHKTAIVDKENRPKGLSLTSRDVSIKSKPGWTKVLCSRQKQNTEGSESVNASSQSKKHNPQSNEKEQSNRTRGAPCTQNLRSNPAKAKETSCEAKGSVGGDNVDSEALEESFELSFKEKLRRWESERRVESVELGEFELLEQAAEELSFSSNSSFVMKVLQMDLQRQQVNGLHLRRLSSTPIKSPPRCVLKRSCSEGSGVGPSLKSSSVISEEREEQIRGDAQQSVQDKERQTEEKENNEAANTGRLSFPEQSNVMDLYDKHAYENEDSSRDSTSTSDVTQEEEDQRYTDESTLVEDGHSQQRRVVFDDDDTWNDMEESTISSVDDISEAVSNRTSPVERPLVRKVAASKAVEPSTPEEDAPPGSQLMIRLFPSLKPKVQTAPPPPPPPAAAKEETFVGETGRQIQSVQLRQRLVELEIEIERFRKENAALAKLRQESETKQESLRKECLEFERMKAEEGAKFEEYKKEENRKLQKERKVFEKHAAASRAIPDKKEREEIQMLKQQLGSLQEELRRRESRWSLTNSRLRQQMDSLSEENAALRDEIQMLEKLRLTTWNKPSLSADDPESKEPPGVPSGNKGVTFASPLDSRGSSSSPPDRNNTGGNRRSSKDAGQPAAAGMKSSLRKPVLLGSSSSLPSRKAEQTSVPAGKTVEKQTQQKAANSGSSPGSSDVKISQMEESELIECSESESTKETITHSDGRVEKFLVNGDRVIVFPNGTRKEISSDGQSVTVTFFNGDTKQATADQRVIYFYAEARTTHITYPDGMEVLHFPNDQTEKHFPDGRKEITFPDQTVKNLFPDGREESVLTDGTIIQVNPDGTKEIHFNTGQKEIHTAEFKQREYPDGTVKTVYSDGRQETRYPTGRLRIKDKDGIVVADNMP